MRALERRAAVAPWHAQTAAFSFSRESWLLSGVYQYWYYGLLAQAAVTLGLTVTERQGGREWPDTPRIERYLNRDCDALRTLLEGVAGAGCDVDRVMWLLLAVHHDRNCLAGARYEWGVHLDKGAHVSEMYWRSAIRTDDSDFHIDIPSLDAAVERVRDARDLVAGITAPSGDVWASPLTEAEAEFARESWLLSGEFQFWYRRLLARMDFLMVLADDSGAAVDIASWTGFDDFEKRLTKMNRQRLTAEFGRAMRRAGIEYDAAHVVRGAKAEGKFRNFLMHARWERGVFRDAGGPVPELHWMTRHGADGPFDEALTLDSIRGSTERVKRLDEALNGAFAELQARQADDPSQVVTAAAIGVSMTDEVLEIGGNWMLLSDGSRLVCGDVIHSDLRYCPRIPAVQVPGFDPARPADRQDHPDDGLAG